ncbi:hypothetical protein BGW80DRAFT_1313646 [Lactifluus volemus]|nr:hypothetical protein BGW80DRAFT_1313646 [Lactifluus volemus]
MEREVHAILSAIVAGEVSCQMSLEPQNGMMAVRWTRNVDCDGASPTGVLGCPNALPPSLHACTHGTCHLLASFCLSLALSRRVMDAGADGSCGAVSTLVVGRSSCGCIRQKGLPKGRRRVAGSAIGGRGQSHWRSRPISHGQHDLTPPKNSDSN